MFEDAKDIQSQSICSWQQQEPEAKSSKITYSIKTIKINMFQ